MQNPITPTRLVQAGRPDSQPRTDSRSSKVCPVRRLMSRNAVRRQVSGRPQKNRSGATDR
jgi:hypothetical protein